MMNSYAPCAAMLLILAALSGTCSASDVPLCHGLRVAVQAAVDTATPQNSTLRREITTAGNHFAVSSGIPVTPAPTLFIIANSIDAMTSDPTQLYTATGRDLERHGWIYVVLDPPCEGSLRKEDEPAGLQGWAQHVRRGDDFMEKYVARCRDVLRYLIHKGFTDPERVAVSGTSRGGFCALHFAAQEPLIRVATCIAPVTNPLALSEFSGVTESQASLISLDRCLDKLAGRTVWLSIGNEDNRVSTDDCIQLSRNLVAASRRLRPEQRVIPVELTVGAAEGHRAVDDACQRESEFLQKQIPAK